MLHSTKFICLSHRYSTFYDRVPAPMFRREIAAAKPVTRCRLSIAAAGLYDLFLNGQRITRGCLAPYISAPSDLMYYDTYDLPLLPGSNCLGVIVGTGMQNDIGRWNWRFDRAKWRGCVRFAAAIELTYADGSTEVLEGPDGWRGHDSAIRSDALFLGEIYDARCELPGWNLPGFDDSDWLPALPAERPQGEPTVSIAEPIHVRQELPPVAITRESRGFVYDFGVNTAGVCRLHIRGAAPGQTIRMTFGEILRDGVLDDNNIVCMDRKDYPRQDMAYQDVYICKGAAEETYTPTFTYHGFQYVLVEGLREEQATAELLTCLVMHSDVATIGRFDCSDPCINRLQEMVIRADLSNLHYFPTDCPHREKNGWTGDAALSAEQMILNLGVDNTFREWMKNIRKAQHEDGSIPGYVPTPGWSLNYGGPAGPGWDKVITEIPWLLWRHRGNTEILRENANMLGRYLNYLCAAWDER